MSAPAPADYLAIVERGLAGVYETLKEQFEGGPDMGVRVLWDRRRADRRTEKRLVRDEHRRTERRRPPPETWRTLGFLLAPESSSRP